ncbi:MAG: hypothetical protein ABI426_02270 [Flavobacterium sp.]
MKKLFLFLLVLIAQYSFADSFIIKNDGSKAVIKSNSFRVDANEKKIYYKLMDNDSEIKMSFKDFDYVVFGVNKFKTFKLQNSNEVRGFFVLAETAERTLVSISMPDQDSEESTKVFYLFYVLDKQNTVIDSHEFNNVVNVKNANIRAEIYAKIKLYFVSCDLLLNRLNYFDRNSQQINNTAILGFFDKPVYVSCLE